MAKQSAHWVSSVLGLSAHCGGDERHAVSSKTKCFSPSSVFDLQVTLALLGGMSKFSVILEHSGTSSEVKVQRRHTK